MKYECPDFEADLHELHSTMCSCEPEVIKDSEGNLVVKHNPFDAGQLLYIAGQLINSERKPDSIPRKGSKKRF